MTVVNYAYTAGVQTFTVPAFVTSLDLVAFGGQGANATSTPGGTAQGIRGHKAIGTLAVSPGDTVYIRVGARGGATEFRLNTDDSAHRVLVAGGGGGAAQTGNANSSGVTNVSLISDGGIANSGSPGTLVAAGAGGTTFPAGGVNGTAGSGAAGGNGAFDSASNSNGSCFAIGGKGGGGYFGGGGGGAYAAATPGGGYQNMWATAGYGGDGSSYVGGVTGGTINLGARQGNGAASITYNVPANFPPNMPLLLTPGGGAEYDRSQDLLFQYVYSNPNPADVQSRRILRVRQQGEVTLLIDEDDLTSDTTFTQPSDGTLPTGALEWQVVTYSAAGLVGPASQWEPFLLNDPPDAVTITDPGTDGDDVAIVHNIEWTVAADMQQAFRVSRLNAAGVQVWSSGEQPDAARRDYDVTFPINSVTETVRVENRVGTLWSQSDRVVDVVWEPPPTPTIVVTSNTPNGAVRITFTNPDDEETPAVYNNVYVRRAVDVNSGRDKYRPMGGAGHRIATGIVPGGQHDDWAVASDNIYEYMGEAVSASGTVARTEWVS